MRSTDKINQSHFFSLVTNQNRHRLKIIFFFLKKKVNKEKKNRNFKNVKKNIY